MEFLGENKLYLETNGWPSAGPISVEIEPVNVHSSRLCPLFPGEENLDHCV